MGEMANQNTNEGATQRSIESWLHRMLNIWDVICKGRPESSHPLKSEIIPAGWVKSLGIE